MIRPRREAACVERTRPVCPATTSRSPSSATSPPRPGCDRVSDARVARPRRPRGRRLRGPRRRTSPSLWAEAGIEVTMRTSYAAGHPQVSWRDGYRVIRKAGPLPRVPAGRVQRDDGLARRARRPGRDLERHAVLLAAVGAHRRTSPGCTTCTPRCGEMTLPPRLAAFGNFVESKRRAADLPPHADRHAVGVVEARAGRRPRLQGRPRHASCRPGIDPRFTPGGEKSPTPLVVAVGRLVPVKRFDLLIDALVALKAAHPALEAVIVGEGYQRDDARGPDPRSRRRALDPPARPRRRRRAASTSTGGRGCSRARRPARAGA